MHRRGLQINAEFSQRFWPGGYIFDGYEQEVDEFIAVNDEFRRRVRHTFHMSDYTDDDTIWNYIWI